MFLQTKTYKKYFNNQAMINIDNMIILKKWLKDISEERGLKYTDITSLTVDFYRGKNNFDVEIYWGEGYLNKYDCRDVFNMDKSELI